MNDSYQAKSKWLQERLLKFDDSIKPRVEQTYRNYNNLIRNHIRTETALRFNSTADDSSSGIAIRVVDEFPPIFWAIFEEHDTDFWEVFLRASVLKQTATGLSFIQGNYPQISNLLYGREDGQLSLLLNDFKGVSSFVDEILGFIDHYSVLRRLMPPELGTPLETEVLGAYFYRDSYIHLYWPAIALIAIELGVSIESLTIVTLIHELVHAYTHLGQDTDNDRWDTEAFAHTHLFIVEGLAQFYTELICKKLNSRQPELLTAFLALRSRQSEAYNCYQSWVPAKGHQAEIIRFAMISCRKNRITDFEDFLDRIQETHHRIGA